MSYLKITSYPFYAAIVKIRKDFICTESPRSSSIDNVYPQHEYQISVAVSDGVMELTYNE